MSCIVTRLLVRQAVSKLARSSVWEVMSKLHVKARFSSSPTPKKARMGYPGKHPIVSKEELNGSPAGCDHYSIIAPDSLSH